MMSDDSKLIDCTYAKRRILRGVEELKACALGDGREHLRTFLVHEGTRRRHLSILRSLDRNKDCTKCASSKEEDHQCRSYYH